MFCNKCGTKNEDGAKFCLTCGNALAEIAPVQEAQTAAVMQETQTAAVMQAGQAAAVPPAANRKKLIIGAAVGAGALVLICWIIFFIIFAGGSGSSNQQSPAGSSGSGLFNNVSAAADSSKPEENSDTCTICNKIADMQAEILELDQWIHEHRVDEGSYEFDENEERLAYLKQQVKLLANHEHTNGASSNAVNVTGQAYNFWDVSGTYTGEWESNMPKGKGTFTGSDVNGNISFYYSGDWYAGIPDGEGDYQVKYPYRTESYSGQLRNGKFNGSGTYQQSYSDGYFVVSGTFADGDLSGTGEFKEYDAYGTLIDYGTMGPGWVKITSARQEQESQRAQDALDDATDRIRDYGSQLWDNLWDFG